MLPRLLAVLAAMMMVTRGHCLSSTENAEENRDMKQESKCIDFDAAAFGEDSPSIMYSKPNGRLGNQLVGYSVLSQLHLQLGVASYIDRETRDYLEATFTRDSVVLPVLQDSFCNWSEISFDGYEGHIKPMLKDPDYSRGKIIWPWQEAGYR